MRVPRIRIESDFKDFYDSLSEDTNTVGTYFRYKKDMLSKGKGLAELRRIGIKTIDTRAARDIVSTSNKLVVYTDPERHDGRGRVLMGYEEASMIYPNSLASEFYIEAEGITNKLLQVGSRRFRIILKDNENSLGKGEVQHIDEITPGYNMLLSSPIFSIDYISTRNGMLAITYNNVERLADYDIQQIMSAEQVISEVYNALLKHNKI